VLQALVTSLVLSRLDYGNSVLYELPAVQLQRLQSVQNAAARLIFNLRRSEHVTGTLIYLHWLRVPERIKFKVAVLTYCALHGSAPPYLSDFTRVAAVSSHRGLSSADTDRLIVPRILLVSAGDRSFPVAGATVRNSLPANVTSAASISIFRSSLKT
jgi:hypothetical protein